MTQTHKSAGFGAIGILAAVIVVLSVGFASWFVWHKQTQKDDEAKTPATQASTPHKTASDGTPNRPVTKSVLSKVDAELRDAIIAKTKELAPACVKNNEVVDYSGKPTDPVVTTQTEAGVDDEIGSLAVTKIGCDGGAGALFEKGKDGMWMLRQTSQMTFSCDILASVAPSKKLMTTAGAPGTCVDENGKDQDIDSLHI